MGNNFFKYYLASMLVCASFTLVSASDAESTDGENSVTSKYVTDTYNCSQHTKPGRCNTTNSICNWKGKAPNGSTTACKCTNKSEDGTPSSNKECLMTQTQSDKVNAA